MKKTQIDKAIEVLEAKRSEARMKFQLEDAAAMGAVTALRAQQQKAPVRKPRAVADMPDRKTVAAGQ